MSTATQSTNRSYDVRTEAAAILGIEPYRDFTVARNKGVPVQVRAEAFGAGRRFAGQRGRLWSTSNAGFLGIIGCVTFESGETSYHIGLGDLVLL